MNETIEALTKLVTAIGAVIAGVTGLYLAIKRYTTPPATAAVQKQEAEKADVREAKLDTNTALTAAAAEKLNVKLADVVKAQESMDSSSPPKSPGPTP